MNWIEQDHRSKAPIPMTAEKEALLNKAKEEGLSTVQKEAQEVKPFDPLRFQPVVSPGNYEAEFTRKNDDVVLHFWPFGYHEDERQGRQTSPVFPKGFEEKMRVEMYEAFSVARVTIHKDDDLGAVFVLAKGWGSHQFFHEICIKALQKLHKAMGGEG